MKDYKLHVSEGFKDIYGKEMLVKKALENNVVKLFQSFGYELIKTPGVEYLDVYTLGGAQKPELYNLINRQGEVLSLRSDMTSSVARFVSTNNSLKDGVKKYCYSVETYRYPRQYQGKNHQFLQAGVELIGDDTIEADIATIYLASQVMKKANVKNYTINLGSSLFLNTLFDEFNLNEDEKTTIYKTIESKDYVSLREYLTKNVDENKAQFIIDLMMRGGKLKYIDNLMKNLEGTMSYEALRYLKTIYTKLNQLGCDNIIFDFSCYSYQEYYSGIIFNVYIDSVTKVVINGGRCDYLFKEYGCDTPDIGFGVDLDSLTDYVLQNDLLSVESEKYLAYSSEEDFVYATIENEKFRNEGIIVSQINNLDSIDDAILYAKDHGFTKVIYYKNDSFELKEVI